MSMLFFRKLQQLPTEVSSLFIRTPLPTFQSEWPLAIFFNFGKITYHNYWRNICVIWTSSIISSDQAKITLPDSQRFQWNLYLINNVEDIVVFRFKRVFLQYCGEKTHFKKNQFSNLYNLLLIMKYLISQSF